MEEKDIIEFKIKSLEFVKTKIDIIHKKILILLSASAGAGTLIFKNLNSFWFVVGVILLLFFSYGLFVNYKRLSDFNLNIEKLENEIKRILNVRDS